MPCDAKIYVCMLAPAPQRKRSTATYIKAVIVMEQELELRGKVAQGTGHDAEDEGGGCD